MEVRAEGSDRGAALSAEAAGVQHMRKPARKEVGARGCMVNVLYAEWTLEEETDGSLSKIASMVSSISKVMPR